MRIKFHGYFIAFALLLGSISPAAHAVLDQWGTGSDVSTLTCASFSETCSVGTSPSDFGPFIDNFQQPSSTSSISDIRGSGTGTGEFEAQTPILSNPLLRAQAVGGSGIAFAHSWALMGYTYIGAAPGIVTLTGTLTGTVSNPIGSSFNDISGDFYILSEAALDGYDSTHVIACLFECFSPLDSAALDLAATGSDSADIVLDLNPGDTFYLYARMTAGAAVGGSSDASNSMSFVFSSETSLQSILQSITPDADNDGIPDATDNCIDIANADQRDADADGIGSLCDPDTNNDCQVNFLDLTYFRQVFFSIDPVGDLNGDGMVNFVDLQVVREQFFQTPGPAADPNICTPI